MRRDLGNHDLRKVASQLEKLDINLSDEFRALTEDDAFAEGGLYDVSSEKYPAKKHAARVVQELGASHGIIYLPGKPTQYYEDSDMSPEFRQRKYFFYLTGVNIPDCAATYHISSRRLTLWIPYVPPRRALYFGSPPDPKELKRLYECDEVRYTDDLPEYIRKHVRSSHLYLLHPPSQSEDRFLTSEHVSALSVDTTSLQPAMNRARVVKDAHELALIRRAVHISSLAHRLIAKHLLSMSSERDIHALFLAACTARAAPAMAYPVIAGAGANASTLHYIDNSADLKGNALVVIDAGCEFKGYASDITRTLPISGKFEGKAKEIYEIVQAMQGACIAALKPGIPYRRLNVLAADIALTRLLELGILKGDRDEIRAQGTVSAFFPHGLGHHVGLEVHDVNGDLPLLGATAETCGDGKAGGAKREFVTDDGIRMMMREEEEVNMRPGALMESGMVVTIEPGIYFCRPFLESFVKDPAHAQFIDWDVLEEYYPVGGVRIEDVLLVTDEGNENLSWRAPKGKELEDVINGRTD